MRGLDNLSPSPGSKKRGKRVGRGNGSGHGTYSTRGCNGQKSRSGGGVSRYFEGGQLPLVKRLPHHPGFKNIFRVEYTAVNVDRLNIFEAKTTVTPQELYRAGLIRSVRKPVKILGNGSLGRPIVVVANKFSRAARAKIEAVGGQVEEL